MTEMARRMLRDRIMDNARDGNDYEDGRYMRDRAMDRMDRAGHADYRRRGSNGRYTLPSIAKKTNTIKKDTVSTYLCLPTGYAA